MAYVFLFFQLTLEGITVWENAGFGLRLPNIRKLWTDVCRQEAWGAERFLWRWELVRKCFPLIILHPNRDNCNHLSFSEGIRASLGTIERTWVRLFHVKYPRISAPCLFITNYKVFEGVICQRGMALVLSGDKIRKPKWAYYVL